MEVLFVSHKYPPATGGMEKQSFELIKGMEAYAIVHKIVYDGSESRLSFFGKLNQRIQQKLQDFPGIGIIHLNDGLLAAVCSFHKGYGHIPVVITIHGLDVTFPSRMYGRYILSRFNRFAGVIAVSEATARVAVARGINRQKVHVVSNGVDVTENPLTSPEEFENLRKSLNLPDKKILLMLGRPVQRKGFSWFIQHVLPAVNLGFQVVMVGPFKTAPDFAEKVMYVLPGGLAKKIMLFLGYPSDERSIRKILQTEAGVVHLGHQPYSVIQSLFKHSSAFVMPNISVEGDMEGFGLVCLEASVNGALVLAADIDGIPGAVQHLRNGILLESGNKAVWVAKLKELKEKPDDFLELRQEFRNFTVAHYSWDKMVRGYWEIFKDITI